MISFAPLALAATAAAVPRFSLNSRQTTGISSNITWTSSDILVSPKNDSRNVAGIKDPSIVYYNNAYHVFASIAKSEGYNLLYFNFTDFSKVFYFEPQKLCTNKDISDPVGWTAPETFYSGTPALIAQVDMWVICDDANCHLFSHDDNGRLYRSQTSLSQFPKGMSDPVISMEMPRKEDLFEASKVYAVNNSTYLLLVECIGEGNSGGGLRYFRSWTSNDIAGPWTALAATQSHPFMGEANVRFPGTKWTKSISHGEMIRTDVDQHLRIDPCGWRFLYQGIDPTVTADYNSLPWHLGLVTQEGGC
ncbi:glycosyl hydrolase family 62-domain-containing protein [Phaeosphaeriaceae sp. PMI808]|nr:glycosyl hydrolase family 62-domain-containing protein [Phaeosphaeriaceae sp. PMI808]